MHAQKLLTRKASVFEPTPVLVTLELAALVVTEHMILNSRESGEGT